MKIVLILVFLSFTISSCHSQQSDKNVGSKVAPSVINNAAKWPINIVQKSYPNLMPGAIAPDAVRIDADRFEQILNGAIIIKKGHEYALIDINGKFIVPWGRYIFEYQTGFFPLIRVIDAKSSKTGWINSKGEFVIPMGKNSADFNANGIATINLGILNGKINTQGKILANLEYPDGINNNTEHYHLTKSTQYIPYIKMVDYYEKGSKFPRQKRAYGYTNSVGKIVIPSQFDKARQFSEGLAWVMKFDEFGVEKWGAINTNGILVIPYKFQNLPADFHNELAMVTPAKDADADFLYAYVDKKGNIKFKVPINQQNKRLQYYPVEGDFNKGYSFWKLGDSETLIMDTTGVFQNLTMFAKDKSMVKDDSGLSLYQVTEEGIYFYSSKLLMKGPNYQGMIDYGGNTIFPPIFDKLKADKFSRYALASISEENSYRIIKDGVVNSQGIFVLLIAERSTF